MGGKVKVVAAFPFLRDEEANGSFEIGGKLSFFLSSPDLEFRAGGVLHLDRDYDRKVTPLPVNGMINIPFQTQPAWRPSGITKEADALKEFDFVLGHAAGPVAEWFNGHDIVTVRYRWEQTYTKVSEDPPTYQWLPEKMPEETKAEYAHCSMPPIDAAGAVNGNYAKDDEFLKIVNGNGGDNVVFQACVWVWVKDTRSNKLVDLVPACMKDDDELNSFNNFSTPIGNFLKDIGGSPYPLMKFTGAGDAFKYSLDELKGSLAADGRQVIITPRAVMVADPRYNYAPEHWFEFKDSDGALTKEKWLEKCERGKDDRDRDIFMATSDMGHLQSVYELAFLPRLTDLRGHGENTYYGDMNRLNGMTKFADAFEGSANSHLAWRTYRCFSLSLEHSGYRDDFEGVGFNSEGSGFRVNPYSSSTPIIMAALANTPYNWMVASTNETAPNALSKSDREVKNFVKNYCFNQMGPLESRFDWKDLELVANQIKSAARGAVGGNWQTAFDNLDWAGNFSDLAGANFLEDGLTVDLYDVDRKFLYGFWRDSFAVKQQLFLVFVRAEPLMMGGGAIGQTPPQLGARAVALVWRDPTIDTANPDRPHRTRILFYRQFD